MILTRVGRSHRKGLHSGRKAARLSCCARGSFASIGTKIPGVSIKTDSIETAEMLIEMGVGRKAPYFHRSWINVPWDLPEDELRQRLADSYGIVRSGLTRKVQASLAPFD